VSQYPQRYNNNYYYRSPRTAVVRDNTANSYNITITIQLYPGTSIPPEELPKLKCNKKWNAVKKAYSDFTGKPYVLEPYYEKNNPKKINANANKNTNTNINTNKNITNRKVNINNRTRRNYNQNYYPNYNQNYYPNYY
jgi:hypothetical protein